MRLFSICLLFPFVLFGNIESARLILRPWDDTDLEIIYEMMQDPDMTQYIAHHHLDQYSTLEKMYKSASQNIKTKGYGYFVCALKDSGEPIGFIGLNDIAIDAPYFPCTTVSWVIGKKYWHNGYATEAAKAVLEFGFHQCHMSKICACTSKLNNASIAVMKHLGMEFVSFFNYPGISSTDSNSLHVLYSLNLE